MKITPAMRGMLKVNEKNTEDMRYVKGEGLVGLLFGLYLILSSAATSTSSNRYTNLLQRGMGAS